MSGETKTTALVATTLGMATVAAMVAVIGATASRADANAPKILDRISDTRAAIGVPLERPASPAAVRISDVSGTTVYSADPASRETVIAKDVPQTSDRIPVPMARSEAVLGLEVALAAPLPRPTDRPFSVGMRLPLPRPDAAVAVASVRQPLPKPMVTAAAVPWPTGPGADEGMIHLSAYTPADAAR